MAVIRTFVAVELADAVKAQAVELANRLRVSGSQVKWVEPEQMHLTLKFLGDVPEADVYGVCQAVERAVVGVASFGLQMQGMGAFPSSSRPRTLWMGITEGSDAVSDLQANIEAALERLGYPKERRAYTPHLTLGRIRRPDRTLATLSELIAKHANFDAGRSWVEEVVVFSSQLERQGPEYTPLSRHVLGRHAMNGASTDQHE